MKLRDYLVREGLTITQAAAQLGISRNHLSFCMNGLRRPSPELAQAITDFTKGEVSPDELIKPRKPKKRCPCCKRVIMNDLYQIKGYDKITGETGYWKFVLVGKDD